LQLSGAEHPFEEPHRHSPPEHELPRSPQALPQEPQLLTSLSTPTQLPPQHSSLAPHTLPQDPQLFGSSSPAMQDPSQ
jgi:hypothetical protein